MHLTPRDLDRTLLLRQHLLTRSTLTPLEMVDHLVGLQAQDNLPPYLSLAARIDGFDPRELSRLLESREAVRFLVLRGTVHVLTPADALRLRVWVQPMMDRGSAGNQLGREAAHVPPADLVAAAERLLADGPLPLGDLAAGLHALFPDAPAPALGHVARGHVAMLQVPPRGMWRRSGGVVYTLATEWLGEPLAAPDVPTLVRRYLRAFGPGTAADMTAWSGVTRLGPVLTAMREELETHTGPDGKILYDVPGAPLATADTPAPPRLLGKYDNLWLSHASRGRVLTKAKRHRWMAPNGGIGNAILLDGEMEGIWTVTDGAISLDLWRDLGRRERADLDEEVDRMISLLAVPAEG